VDRDEAQYGGGCADVAVCIADSLVIQLVVKIGDFHAKSRCAHTSCAHTLLPFYPFITVLI